MTASALRGGPSSPPPLWSRSCGSRGPDDERRTLPSKCLHSPAPVRTPPPSTPPSRSPHPLPSRTRLPRRPTTPSPPRTPPQPPPAPHLRRSAPCPTSQGPPLQCK
ncbi:hypothetical protein J437_LFUL011682 [Ladona fulva]|uniref:Uncharacterized protein n=1 Tax=Ladona fulva TaxID=123851 RepID=A0A8K0KE72_LADFU|nr:hypothetical protein J437_LFUL011682 [Ladona fulva]